MKILKFIFVVFLTLFCGFSCGYDTESRSISDQITSVDNPDRVVLCVTKDPTTSMGFNFEISEDVEAFIEYRRKDIGEFIRQATTPKTTMVGSYEVYHRETVISGLIPGTLYEYRIVGTQIGKVHTFKTAQVDPNDVTVMLLTDPQGNGSVDYSTYANIILRVQEKIVKKVDFALFSGDMVNDNSDRSQWNFFFRYSAVFSLTTPIAATTGNHETGSFSDSQIENIEYSGYFNFPKDGPTYETFDVSADDYRKPDFDLGKTYSFDYGSAHFVAINSEIFQGSGGISGTLDMDNIARFSAWLEADLNSHSDQWIIVFLHRGPYSLHYDSVNVRTILVPILEEYGVDLVLSGHDHRYSRTVYNQGEFIGFSDSTPNFRGQTHLIPNLGSQRNLNDYSSSLGVTYVVGNSSSVKFYGDDDGSDVLASYEYNDKNPVIPIITITPEAIEFTAYVLEKSDDLAFYPDCVSVLESFIIRP